MIIDSHVHAWTTWPYAPAVPDPGSRGTVEQLLFEMDRHGVDRAVVICARIDHNPDNNAYVASAAARHPDRLVAFPDVDSSWSPEYHTPGAAARLGAVADRWPIAGFTHYLGAANDGWLVSPDGAAFFAEAARRNLVVSLAASPDWFADIARIAAAHPWMPIVLHHQGMTRGATPDAPELAALLALAAHPSIAVKASGFYYASGPEDEYPYAAQVAVFEHIHRAFGARRLAWGSDFPPSAWAACTYRQALDVVRRHCTFLGADDLAWVMGGTMAALLDTGRPVPVVG